MGKLGKVGRYFCQGSNGMMRQEGFPVSMVNGKKGERRKTDVKNALKLEGEAFFFFFFKLRGKHVKALELGLYVCVCMYSTVHTYRTQAHRY